MSDRITVRAGDRGLIWVFAVDLDGAEATAFGRRDGEWPVQKALGAKALDPEHVDLFPVHDLEGVGLSGYLEEGLGVPPDQLDDMRARLDAQRGWVLVLTSKALDGTAQTLTPRAPLRLLASFSEDRAPVAFEKLPPGIAAGMVADDTAGTPVPDGRSRIVALVSLLMALIVVLVVLVLS